MSRFLLTLSLSAVALTASAVTPLWLRDAAISPDGSRIAFTYKGDILQYRPEAAMPHDSQLSTHMRHHLYGRPTEAR